MTEAGMRLDRAGGGAASGEEERLPGRLSLFSFFHERKIWIEDPFNRDSESCRRQSAARKKTWEQGNIMAAKKRIHRESERKIRTKRSERQK